MQVLSAVQGHFTLEPKYIKPIFFQALTSLLYIFYFIFYHFLLLIITINLQSIK